MDPKSYWEFRIQCGIWEMSRDRRKREAEIEKQGEKGIGREND
jgi:hypothetical protein